jgi:hypothetical protein
MTEDGRAGGAVVRGKDGLLKTIAGDNVVLACGGFEGNYEMLTAYTGKNAVDLPLIAPGLKYNTVLPSQLVCRGKNERLT